MQKPKLIDLQSYRLFWFCFYPPTYQIDEFYEFFSFSILQIPPSFLLGLFGLEEEAKPELRSYEAKQKKSAPTTLTLTQPSPKVLGACRSILQRSGTGVCTKILYLLYVPSCWCWAHTAPSANPHRTQNHSQKNITAVRGSSMNKITIRCLSKQEDFRLT